MKRRVLSLFLAAALMVGNVGMASPQASNLTEQQVPHVMPMETIDNIKVPYGILLDIQMEFQGFAVSDARQYNRAGQQVYSLRVENSDSGGRGGFYLLFNTDWKYVGRERVVSKPAPQIDQPRIAEEDLSPAPDEESEEQGQDESDGESEDEPVERPRQPRRNPRGGDN